MGHSRAEKERSRERILEAAARLIREVGPNGIGIADLMKSVDLTHGGFYVHFPSRDALIVAAVERAIDDGVKSFAALPDAGAPGTVMSIANRYLSAPHRDNISRGCAIAALATDVGRLDEQQGRDLLGEHTEARFQQMTEAMGGGAAAKDAAVAAWCLMVGAVELSRVFKGTKRADEVLEVARQTVSDLAATVDQNRTREPGTKRRSRSKGTRRGAPRPPAPDDGSSRPGG